MGDRSKVCRSCNIGGLTADELYKVLKETYRNYHEYREHVARTGQDVISHAIRKSEGTDEYTTVSISFSDLQDGVSELAPRKKEAFYLHIICNMLQREVADVMGVTTVTVGQYVDDAMRQLSKRYFAEEIEDDDDGTTL